MSNYIFTFGSCLSAKIADAIVSRTSYRRISSIQHFRMDVYVDTYLLNKYEHLKKDNFNFKYKKQYEFANLIENQQDDVGLGHALPNACSLVHHRKAIESGKISLLLIDNFADIYFKVYYNKKTNHKLFLNKEYFEELDSDFSMEENFEDIDIYIEQLKVFIADFKKYNPVSEVVFINFPVNLNTNELVSERALQMARQVANEVDVKIVDPIGIYEHDLVKSNDIHHFNKRKYEQLSHIVLGELYL